MSFSEFFEFKRTAFFLFAEIFSYILKVFTVTLDLYNASLLNTSINLLQTLTPYF